MRLRVMTFNLRFASEVPPHEWRARRPVVAECLRVARADVIGTQEGWAHQIEDIVADHPEYEPIGTGREADGAGETVTVLYRRERLDAVDHGHFWLSDTPGSAGSTSWGNTLPRMVTWVRLRDRETGTDCYVVNTHLDHESAAARVRGAGLICTHIGQRFAADVPVVVTGDFNEVSEQSPAHDVFLDAGFSDARTVAVEIRGPRYDSFHDFAAPVAGDRHIDWILIQGTLTVQRFELFDVRLDGQYPSDHFPLLATVELPA